MKTFLAIAVIWCAAHASMGQVTDVDKSKRMLQIEKKYNMVMVLVDKENNKLFWLFKKEYRSGVFAPVMMKAEVTDKEVEAAMLASLTCAVFKDVEIKKAQEAHQPSEQNPMIYQ